MSSPKDKRGLSLPVPQSMSPPSVFSMAPPILERELSPEVFFSSSPLTLQQSGQHLLGTLALLADALEQTPQDEETLQMAFHSLELHINVLFEAEAQLVLSGHAGCFLLNQEMIELAPEEGWRLTQCWRRLEQKGLGGFMVMRSVDPEEFRGFFAQLMSRSGSPDATNSLYPLSYDNAVARISAYQNEKLAGQGLEQVDPLGFAISLYAQILLWVEQRYHPLRPKPPRKVVARALQAFAALCEGQQVFFLGFAAMEGRPNYQAHHLTNTAITSLLFGESLGLSRAQRLELALITLEHDLGKIDLPPALRQKAGPLSDDELQTIELLPLRTARRLLEQRFAWSRLKQALIAIDVHVRPGDAGVVAEESDERDETLYLSRIIRICASFDSLCSQRPFRPAMSPDEALCFMRGSLSERFDPVLLQKFVAFLIPAIHSATGRLLHPLPPRQDIDKLRRASRRSSPLLEDLQRLCKQYQVQVTQPTEASWDEQEMSLLRIELTRKLQAAAMV